MLDLMSSRAGAKLLIRNAVLPEFLDLLPDERECFFLGIAAHGGGDGEHAGLLIGGREAADAVAEAVLFADGLEEAGGHAAAEGHGEHLPREAVRIAVRQAGEGETEVVLLRCLALYDHGGRVSALGGTPRDATARARKTGCTAARGYPP